MPDDFIKLWPYSKARLHRLLSASCSPEELTETKREILGRINMYGFARISSLEEGESERPWLLAAHELFISGLIDCSEDPFDSDCYWTLILTQGLCDYEA